MAQNIFLPSDHALAAGRADTVDLTVGGQQGAMTDPLHWFHNDNYVKQRVIPFVLRTPTAWRWCPNGANLAKQFKALVELHSISITGIDISHTSNFVETELNNTEMLDVLTKVTRSRSTPTHQYIEKAGKPITKLHTNWQIDLGQDPETGKPGINRYPAYIDAGRPALTPEMKTAAILYVEPSANMAGVVDAVLCYNMAPKLTPNQLQSVKQADLEIVRLDIEYTATSQIGDGIMELARFHLNSINTAGYAPHALAAAFDSIDPALTDEAGTNGWTTAPNALAAALGG